MPALGAGDPSASTQVHTGRGIWVRRLFWSLLKPLRMRCSTFSGLDKQVGAGEKKCTRPPNTQPTTWTSSALKTCLLGLTFGLFVSRLLLLSCLLAQAFPVEVFFQLTSWKDAFCSRGSVNKISFFFHAFSVVDLTPEFHSGYVTGCCLAGMVVLAVLSTGVFILHTPTQATALRKWKEARTESLSSHPALACVTLHYPLALSWT